MWVVFALASAVFAGVVAILAKAGIAHVSSNVVTAIRTAVVLVLAWGVVVLVGSQSQLPHLSNLTWMYLVASGVATGGSWLCFFRALQLGTVDGVAVVDRSSLILTVVVGIAFLGEARSLPVQLAGLAALLAGTYLMVRWPGRAEEHQRRWLGYAIAAAILASAATILAKIGIAGLDASLGTAIRTSVVLVMAIAVVLVAGEVRQFGHVPRRDLVFIALSGIATGASWLCFYKALQDGPVSAVLPIDKLSIVVTVVLAYAVFGERLSRRGLLGLTLLVVGTVALAL